MTGTTGRKIARLVGADHVVPHIDYSVRPFNETTDHPIADIHRATRAITITPSVLPRLDDHTKPRQTIELTPQQAKEIKKLGGLMDALAQAGLEVKKWDSRHHEVIEGVETPVPAYTVSPRDHNSEAWRDLVLAVAEEGLRHARKQDQLPADKEG